MKKLTCLNVTSFSRHIVRSFPQLASSLISLSLRIPELSEAKDGQFSLISYNDFSPLHRLTSLTLSLNRFHHLESAIWSDTFVDHPHLDRIQFEAQTSATRWFRSFFATVPRTCAHKLYETNPDHERRMKEWLSFGITWYQGRA
jgi:hypothetical protein